MNLRQDVKPEHVFYCIDGAILKNLKELTEKLKSMGREAYAHHANMHRNDFHNWIKDVYGNERLAKRVASAKNSKEASKMLEAQLGKKKRKTAKKPAKNSNKKEQIKKNREKKSGGIKRSSKRSPKKRKVRLHKLHKRIHRHLAMFAKKYGLA